jgi:hypothetical protein
MACDNGEQPPRIEGKQAALIEGALTIEPVGKFWPTGQDADHALNVPVMPRLKVAFRHG